MQRLRITQLFITVSAFLVMAMAHAGNPVWTFESVVGFPPTATVDKMGSATVKYTVTNQSSRKHTLVMLPQKGISQTQPCQLAPKGTCTLTLNVNGSAVPASGISSGPALCQVNPNGTPNPSQCYRPNQGNELHITVTTGPTVPAAPTNVNAVAGNVSAEVSWVAPADDGGSPITGYTATSSPGGLQCTAVGETSCTVEGLANGTSYTFTVTATNAVGTGPASNPSNAVTPATVPGTPTNVIATAENASALINWTAPADDGGSAITGYTVTSSPGS
ncbi:hypothetical protein Lsan_0823, partial [Legionella santicrucis]